MIPSSPLPAATVAERLVARLEEAGVTHAFHVPGLHIDPLLLALARSSRITPVRCTQELGAGYMAHGHSLRTEDVSVCLAMGGPGASALLPAAVCARVEGARVLFITGGVPAWAEDWGAFQEGGPFGSRDLALLGNALEHSWSLAAPEELDALLNRAFSFLRREGGGPVHLQIRHDLLVAPWAGAPAAPPPSLAAPAPWNPRPLEAWARGLGPRWAVYVGDAPVPLEAFATLRAFAEAFQVPVATTLGAKGALPEDHPLSLGHFGFGGSPRARAALLEPPPDALLVLGADLGDRNTHRWEARLQGLGPRLLWLAPEQPPSNPFTAPFSRLPARWDRVLEALMRPGSPEHEALAAGRGERGAWLEGLGRIPLSAPTPADPASGLHPREVLEILRERLPREAPLFLDAGAHRIFGAHYWRALAPRSFHSASRSAPTGWAIAAGMGAAFRAEGGRVWVLTGDGCMRMLGLEVATAAEQGLPVTFVVLNNGAMGSVLARYGPEGPRAEALARLPDVDWAAFGHPLGVAGARASNAAELREALAQAESRPGPFLLDVRIPAECPPPEPASLFSPCGPMPRYR